MKKKHRAPSTQRAIDRWKRSQRNALAEVVYQIRRNEKHRNGENAND